LCLADCRELFNSVGSSVHAVLKARSYDLEASQLAMISQMRAENSTLKSENDKLQQTLFGLRQENEHLERKIQDLVRSNKILEDVGGFHVRKTLQSKAKLEELIKSAQIIHENIVSMYPSSNVL
jgi:regulator of replication initiation timing